MPFTIVVDYSFKALIDQTQWRGFQRVHIYDSISTHRKAVRQLTKLVAI